MTADPSSQPLLRSMLEAIASQLGMGRGRWTLELRFQNGRLDRWFRHEEHLAPDELARFEEAGA